MIAYFDIKLSVVFLALFHSYRSLENFTFSQKLSVLKIEKSVFPMSIGFKRRCAKHYFVFQILKMAVEPGDKGADL
jgi:hypothetical protein